MSSKHAPTDCDDDVGLKTRTVPLLNDYLAHGGNVNQVDSGGRPLLLLQTGDYNLPLMRCLLRNGADSDLSDPEGLSPLHFAQFARTSQCTKLLLEYGADPNARWIGSGAVTPLHLIPRFAWPVYRNPSLRVRMLVAAGADINAIDGQGVTPLYWALQSERWGLVKTLLELGAVVTKSIRLDFRREEFWNNCRPPKEIRNRLTKSK